MSYYILAHRRKRIEALDLENAFTISIIAREGSPVGILVENDPEEDVDGVSGGAVDIRSSVVSINEQGQVVVDVSSEASFGGDVEIPSSILFDVEIVGDVGDEEQEGEIPTEG